MATASIGSTFCVTIDCSGDAAAQATQTITVGRPCQVLLIEVIFSTVTGGTTTLQFNSDATGSAGYTDMFGGAVASKINNVNLVAQAAASGGGSIVLSPEAGTTLTSASGKLQVVAAGANTAYVVRFICTAQTPEALTVTTT